MADKETFKLFAEDLRAYVKYRVFIGYDTICLFSSTRRGWALRTYSPVLEYVVDHPKWVFEEWAPPSEKLLASICSEVCDFPFTIQKAYGEIVLARVYNLKASHIESASLPPSSQSGAIADCPQTQDHQTLPW